MKFTNPWIDPRVQSVRSADVQTYLRRRGWQPRPYPRPQVLLFEGPRNEAGEPIVQMVPANERARDYLQCLIDLITSLALIEDRYAVEVLNDILQIGAASPQSDPDGRDHAPQVATSDGVRS